MANKWFNEIAAVEQQLGLPTGLLQAIATNENASGDTQVVSKAAFPGSSGGAVGVMQVMPDTFANLKLQGKLPPNAKITDPIHNILAGGHVLKEGLTAAKGDVAKAVAYYNTTPKRALSGNLLPETQAYVPKVLATYKALGGTISSDQPSVQGPTMSATTDSASTLQTIQAATQELLSSLSANNALRVQTGNTLVQSQEAIKRSGEEAAQAAQEEANAKAGQDLIAGQRASKFEANAAAILASLGMSPDQTDNFRGTMLSKIQDIAAEKLALRAAITERQSVGIFDNPITWLMNQLALPGEIGRHNALLQTQLGLESDLQRNVNMTSTELGQAVTIANQKTGSELVQQAQAEVAAGKSKVAQLQAANAGNAAATALQLQALQSSESKDEATRLGLATDELSRARQAEEFKMKQAQFELMQKDHTAVAEMKAEKKAEYEATMANLQLVNQALGLNLTPAVIASMPTKQRAKLMEGMPMNGVFGGNVPEAIIFTTNFANIPVLTKTSPTQAYFISSLRKSLEEQKSLLTPAEILGKKADDIEVELAQRVGKKLLDGAKNTSLPVFSGGANPYRATYSLLSDPQKTPELRGNIVAATVKSFVQSLGGVDKVNDAMLLGAIGAIVQKGEVPVELAAKHIAQFYTVAKETNNKAMKFELYNLPTQTQYLAPVPGMSKSSLLDLSNEQAVKNRLVQAVVRAQVQEYTMYAGQFGGMIDMAAEKLRGTTQEVQQ